MEPNKRTQSSSSWRTAGGPVDKSLVKRPRTWLQHLYCLFYLDDITLNKMRCFPDAQKTFHFSAPLVIFECKLYASFSLRYISAEVFPPLWFSLFLCDLQPGTAPGLPRPEEWGSQTRNRAWCWPTTHYLLTATTASWFLYGLAEPLQLSSVHISLSGRKHRPFPPFS